MDVDDGNDSGVSDAAPDVIEPITDATTDASSPPTDAGAQCTVPPVTITHSGGTPSDAVIHFVSTATHPEAVCNDGSPAAYIVRRGFGSGARRWVIYLEGGGACTNAADCAERYRTQRALMSSSTLTAGSVVTTQLEAIKSVDRGVNPDFFDANYVQLLYCSSDTWSGDRAGDPAMPTSALARWHFRGRRIVEGVVRELQTQGLADADEVFLMGSSAGGFGVIAHADDIREALPARTRFVAMIDAAFYVDYPAFDAAAGVESTDSPTARARRLADAVQAWGGRGDASCEASVSADLRAMCRSNPFVIANGHLVTELFVRQSLRDGVQTGQDLVARTLLTPAANAYRMRFWTALRNSLLQPLPTTVFATNDAEHGVINSTSEWSAAVVDAVPLSRAIGRWYRAPCANRSKLVAPL